MNKVVITVVGKDKVGILAKICSYLAEANISVLNISQQIVDGYFNMIMIANINDANDSFDNIQDHMYELGNVIGCVIHIQKEEIFDSMQRI